MVFSFCCNESQKWKLTALVSGRRIGQAFHTHRLLGQAQDLAYYSD